MAPSRRKGASKAAIAAAARRQWKVGDLVLAKVKGFPAWPATVSEPKAWGYKSDTKKVLVFFFGTKQIAFCNPIDVEPFTEEKKEILLVKRPGRSADFLRAVQEIVECFDKLKEQGGADEPASDEAPVENANVRSSDLKNSLLPTATQNSRGKSLESVDEKTAPSTASEDGAGLKDLEASQDTVSSEDPSKGSLTPDKSVPNVSMAGRTRSAKSQATQHVKPSVRRCRSSRLGESGNKSSNDCAYDGPKNESLNRSMRRQKRKIQGLDPLACNVGVSAVHNSNGDVEDNSSEASIADSDTLSNNEDGAVVSNNKHNQAEHPIKSHELNNPLSKGLEFHMKTVILRKKRNPGRKRMAIDVAEFGAQSDLEEVKNTKSLLPAKRESVNRNSKEDGDEHLPLLKRARVRMGKTAPIDEQLELLIERGEKPSVSPANSLRQDSTMMDSAVTHGLENCSLNVKDTLAYSSPSEGSPTVLEDKSLVWKARKGQTFSCSYDGEAALPPSKRLHRALEAMSANAVEEFQPSFVASTCREGINECANVSPKINSPTIVKQEQNKLGCDESSNCAAAAAACDDSIINTSSRPSTFEDVSVDHDVPNNFSQNTDHEKNEFGQNNDDEAVVCPSADAVERSNDVAGAAGCVLGLITSKLVSNSLLEESNIGGVQCVSDHLANEDTKEVERVVELHNCTPEDSPGFIHSAKLELRSNHTPGDLIADKFRCQDSKLLPQCNEETESCKPVDVLKAATVESEASQHLKQSIAEKLEAASLQETMHIPTVVRPSSPALDVAVSPRLCCSTSVSAAKVSDQAVLNSQVGGRDTTRMVSPPPTTSGASDGSYILQNKRCSTPDANLCDDKHDSPVGGDAFSRACPLPTASVTASDNSNILQNKGCCTPAANFQYEKHESPVGGVDTLMRVCPLTTSVTASNNSHILKNKGFCTPDVNEKHASHLDESIKFNSELSDSIKPTNKSGNDTEVKAALVSLETTLGTLTRTKESIGKATRIAMDCAKFGIATEVVEILARYLERESILHRRVDLFFLVDSIAQCSRGLKGSICDVYLSAIQATLPRLLAAAAPSGYVARENRRQCLKVLKLWQERRILPESIIRQHIRELDSQGSSSSTGGYSRRMSRTERSFDDPIREMEGMLVDEYGSNSSFHLPGFCMPRTVKVEDDGSDSDEGSFEAVTPEHETGIPPNAETSDLSAMEKHRHILEDVDGELEMEDVAPSCEDTRKTVSPMGSEVAHASNTHDQSFPSFAPPLPCDIPPPEPPLPKSPPPLPPPPPPMALPLPPPPPMHPLPPPPPPPTMSYSSTVSHVGVDSQSHLNRQNVQEAMPLHPPPAPRITSQMPMTESSTSCSYNSYPVLHNSVRTGNDSCQVDSTITHNAYHLRPPSVAPSNQFSYFQADHRVGQQQEAQTPSYCDRPQFPSTTEGGHYYDDRERARSGAHDYNESWRFSRPPYHGSNHVDKSRRGYGAQYSDPPREPNRTHNPGWGFRPRPMHHRYRGSSRNFHEGPPPMAIRAPSFWPPR